MKLTELERELLAALKITAKDFEVLEDVLAEIQEAREYEGKDLKSLNKLKRLFSYKNYLEYEKYIAKAEAQEKQDD